MRIHTRYIKRVVIPTLSVGALALIIAIFMRKEDARDDPPSKTFAPPSLELSMQTPEEMEFSPEAVETQTAALERAIAELDGALQRVEKSSENQNLRELRDAARQKIDELAKATEENWDTLQQEAFDRVSEYARVVGRTLESGNGQAATQ